MFSLAEMESAVLQVGHTALHMRENPDAAALDPLTSLTVCVASRSGPFWMQRQRERERGREREKESETLNVVSGRTEVVMVDGQNYCSLVP